MFRPYMSLQDDIYLYLRLFSAWWYFHKDIIFQRHIRPSFAYQLFLRVFAEQDLFYLFIVQVIVKKVFVKFYEFRFHVQVRK